MPACRTIVAWSRLNLAARRGVRARAGYTLVETLVAMTLLATLMTLGATTIWTTLKVERLVDAERQHRRDWHRLAADFRRDAAQAKEAKIDAWNETTDAGGQCSLIDSNDVSTRYLTTERGVRRTSTTVTGRPTVEDYAVFPSPNARALFRVEAQRTTLELSLSPQMPAQPGRTPRTKRIATWLGRDLRLASGGRDAGN